MICSRNFLKQLQPFSDSFLWGSPTRAKNRLIGGHAQMSWSMQIRGCLGTSMTVNVWRSYMWTAYKEVNMKAIFAVMNTIYKVVKNKAWKKFWPVQDFNPYHLQYACSALKTELTSQLEAGHDVMLVCTKPVKHFLSSIKIYYYKDCLIFIS